MNNREELKLINQIKKISKTKIIFIFIMIICFLFLLVCLIMTPKLKLKGSNEITLKYPDKYTEPGYTSKIIGGDITKDVVIVGKVNYSKPGTYTVTYISKNFIFETKVTRTVNVIDDESPIIKLKGNEEVLVCPNQKYKEEGFEITDNFDKNLKPEIIENENEIIYVVKDSSGNKTKKIRKLVYADETKPEIKLKGFSKTYLWLNSKYNDAGFSANDNCDGNLTNKVKVTGKVDTSAPGAYKITYSVSDKAGNKQVVTREVIVQKQTINTSGCGIKGAIYLTFDDGPNEAVTNQILNILKEENVKATFFVTNKGPDYLIKREYEEGHTVGLHTASHNYSNLYSSKEAYFEDLNAVSSRVKRITGYDSKFIRFPGGSSNTVSKKYQQGLMTTLTNEVVKKGYKYYDWNISSEDAGKCSSIRTKECVYQNTVNQLSKNRCNMVLMHDIKSYTANALRDIIKYGKNNGYVFMQINNSTPMVKQRVNN